MIQYYLDFYKEWVHEPNGQPDNIIGPFDGPIRLDYNSHIIDGVDYRVHGLNVIAEVDTTMQDIRVVKSIPIAHKPIQFTIEHYRICIVRAVFVEKVQE